jgi:polyhydroxybutyrate depolymerase
MRLIRRACAAVVASTMLGVVAVAASTAAPASAAGCTLATTNGTITRTIVTSSGVRTYLLHVPSGLTGSSVPLLLSDHGGGAFAAYQQSVTQWSPYADSHNFIVAYPQAIADYWDYSQGSYDVSYLKQVVSDIKGTWCIDPHRVFSDGWSNGALMSQRMACDTPNLFASAVSWAGADPTIPNFDANGVTGSPCTPSRPVAVGIFQGANDPISSPSIGQQNTNDWVGRDGCPAMPISSSDNYGTLLQYQPCNSGVAVWWRVMSNQQHTWPTGTAGQDLRDHMWSFLNNYPLP